MLLFIAFAVLAPVGIAALAFIIGYWSSKGWYKARPNQTYEVNLKSEPKKP